MQSTIADILLDSLSSLDIELFIGSGAGTDFPPIIEAFAKRKIEGKKTPRPVTIIHETTAVAMAHGYAMVSGKTPCVMLHTTVGTANGLCGIINAARARIPMFIWAGRTPISEIGYQGSRRLGIHWAQESFDQAAMIREYVKWDYELRSESDPEQAVARGLSIAQSDPAGPCYLVLPLEVLQRNTPNSISTVQKQAPISNRRANADIIKQIAKILQQSENPLIITSSIGSHADNVKLLQTLSERLAIPVVEHWPTHMNLPRSYELHLGFDPNQFVAKADVIIALETGTPWIPSMVTPQHDATIIQIDQDPLYEHYPMRCFTTSINISASPGLVLYDLLSELEGTIPNVKSRRHKYIQIHESQRESWRNSIDQNASPIDTAWISHCIDEQRKDHDIVITEYVLDQTQMSFTETGTFFNHSPAGGLGWGLGAALGAKLARSESTVICCIGDGAYTFGAPVSTHHASAMHNLPVLFVVYNNGMLNTTKRVTLNFYPDGAASQVDEIPFCDLSDIPRYEEVCKAAGGYGEFVADPSEVPDALSRALNEVRNNNRQALLNVVCGPSFIK